MATQRITERIAAPFAKARVNHEAGTIDDVLICGTESANGRDYPVSVFKRDFSKYEGKPVNCDHGREATVERRFGWFTNVRPGPDGRPRGTLNCLKTHPMYARVMEAAERNPALFGFSHVAMCDTRRGTGGREVVEAIREVESIDLVAQPATTKGLFEGKQVTKITFAQLVEGALGKLAPERARPVRKFLVLAEDDTGMAPMLDTPVDAPADDTGGEDAIKGGIRSIVLAILDDESLSIEEQTKKIRIALQMGEKMSGKAPADTGSKSSDTSSDSSEESKKPRDADVFFEGITACEGAGWTNPGRTDAMIVGRTPVPERPALIERLRRVTPEGHERPTSSGRGRISETVAATVTTTAATESAPPTDPKAFAEWVK